MSNHDSIQDYLGSLGFTIRGEAFVKGDIMIPFATLPGKRIQDFAYLEEGQENRASRVAEYTTYTTPGWWIVWQPTKEQDQPDLWPTLHQCLKGK